MTCSSSNRCRSISCDTCRWRYAGQITRRSLPEARRLVTAEIDICDQSFRSWASRVRNVVQYRRSQSIWFNELSLTSWLCRDNRARGIVVLGSVQQAELIEAFERWPMTLKPVASEDVRAAVYRILHPDRIAAIPDARRYQSIQFSIGSRQMKASSTVSHHEPMSIPVEIAAMPCIF